MNPSQVALLEETGLSILIMVVLLALSLGFGRLLAGALSTIHLHSFVERALLYLLLGITAISWTGTLLAILGFLKWWLWLIVLSVLAMWAARRNRNPAPNVKRVRSTPLAGIIVIVLVLTIAAVLFSRPAESFILVDDSAVYTIGGIVLARSGTLYFQPQSLWTSADLVRQIARADDVTGLLSPHYGPFYQWSVEFRTLEIGFLPLPKVWTALIVWIFGDAHATEATPLFGLIGLTAVYGLTQRLLGWKAALAAVALLTVSLPQIWFARYPISEMYAQAMCLGGVYLAVLSRDNAEAPLLSRRLAIWSGLALATLSLLRLEGLPVLIILAVLLIVAWCRKDAGWPKFVHVWTATLSLFSILGFGGSLSVARHYFMAQTLRVLTPSATRAILTVLTVSALAAYVAWRRWRPETAGMPKLIARVSRRLPLAIAGGWMLWILIAVWELCTKRWGSSLAGWLAQYNTVWGLGLGVVGALWLLWGSRDRDDRPELLALLAMTAFFLLLFSYRRFVTPMHPWAVRRLVPIVLPTLAICVAGLLTTIPAPIRNDLDRRNNPYHRLWALASTLVLAALIVAVGYRSYPILLHREWEGLWAQFEAFAQGLPANAVILYDNGLVGERLTQLTEIVFGRPSLALEETMPDSAIDQIVEEALGQDQPVYLVVTDGDLMWWPERWELVSQGAARIDTTVVRTRRDGPPHLEDVFQRTLWLDTYQITRAAGVTTTLDQPMEITAGEGSYPYLRSGFYQQWDLGADNTIGQWTSGDGLVVAPWPATATNQQVDICIELAVAGGDPPAGDPPTLVVEVEGSRILERQLTRGFSPERLTIPAQAIVNNNNPPLEIRLISDVWDATDLGDQRPLGVLFYGMRVLPPDQCPTDLQY